METHLVYIVQFLQYTLINGSVSAAGFGVMLLGSSYGIPEHWIVGVFNFFAVTITGAINLKTTFSQARVSFWKGLVENNTIRLISGLIVVPFFIWLFSTVGIQEIYSYWITIALTGGSSFFIIRKLYGL